jgi:8-oxo-dGTP pyrophosphatase MutT (NUDIX family)
MDFEDWLTQRLTRPLPGYEAQRKMMNVNRPHVNPVPDQARQAGVLLLIYPEDRDRKLVLIERPKDGSIHSGQVAFPGGKKEDSDPDIIQTALREANEEVNLNPHQVSIIGSLTSLYIPVSNFEVHPVLAFSPAYPGGLKPADAEVARILHFSFRDIFPQKEWVKVTASGFPGILLRTLAYKLTDAHFIWGATAMILSELEALWLEWQQDAVLTN